jgi:hypothetical protein
VKAAGEAERLKSDADRLGRAPELVVLDGVFNRAICHIHHHAD